MLLRPRRAWRPRDFAQLALLLGLGLWLNRQPLWDILDIGLRDQDQTHIFLAPAVALWLVWLRRSRLRYVMVQPSFVGLAVAAFGWLLSWWGFQTGTQVAWHAGAVMSLLGIVLSMTGMTPVVLLGPVFAVLMFMLPIPGEIRHKIAWPMQTLATNFTHAMLELIGVSAIKTGNVIIINGEQVAVGEACNGMRMVFALALVVYAIAFGWPLKAGTRAFLLAASPLIAIVCNVIRLVPTSLMFGYGGSELAQRFHWLAGWVMLPVAVVMLMALLRAIRWLEFPVTQLRLASQ